MYKRQKFTIVLRIGALIIALIFLLGIILDAVGIFAL
jgi:hypothetical protein